MIVLAIDPGPTESAFVRYDGHARKLLAFHQLPNHEIVRLLPEQYAHSPDVLAVEMISSYGMPVGAEVFNTCVWIGRFTQVWPGDVQHVFRREVKLNLCGSARAKDGNVRQALIDRFGGSRETAIGTRKAPGALYGVKSDVWAALAVAVTFTDRFAA